MMQHLLEWFAQIALSTITQFGNWGVFLGMLLESACIPLPSEIIMPFAGYLVSIGKYTLLEVVLAGILGNLLGSWIAYEVGRSGGRILLKKYGKYVLFSEKHLASAEKWFAKYGEWTVFFGRVLPVIRTFISLPAGIAGMNRVRFLLYTFLGCVPWCFLFAFIGLKLGQHWENVRNSLHKLDYPIIAIVILLLIVFIVRNQKRGK